MEAVTATRGPADAVLLTMRHSSGAASTATVALTAPAAAAGVEITLRGSAGTTCLPRRPDGPDGPKAAYHRAVDALLAAAASGLPNACDLRFGLRVTEVLAAAEATLPPLVPSGP